MEPDEKDFQDYMDDALINWTFDQIKRCNVCGEGVDGPNNLEMCVLCENWCCAGCWYEQEGEIICTDDTGHYAD